MQIHGDCWEVHSRNSTKCKGYQESKRPKGVGTIDQTSTVHGLQPVEHLDSRWHSNEHGSQHGHESQHRTHARSEHVMPVNNEPENSDTCECEDHRFVSKDCAQYQKSN